MKTINGFKKYLEKEIEELDQRIKKVKTIDEKAYNLNYYLKEYIEETEELKNE